MSDANDLIKHILENQVQPQLIAQELGGEVEIVDVRPDATNGYVVTCHVCGRTAHAPRPVPEGQVATCPRCVRKMLGIEDL